MALTVTAPLVIITDSVGKLRYYYEGTVLPDDLPAKEIERLREAGMVGGEKMLAADVEGAPTGPAGRQIVDAVPEAGGVQAQRPAQVAPKAAWVDYAVAKGVPRDEAEAASKDDLVKRLS